MSTTLPRGEERIIDIGRGMGHDLPADACAQLVSAIAERARRQGSA